MQIKNNCLLFYCWIFTCYYSPCRVASPYLCCLCRKVLTQIYHVFCIPGGIPKVLIEFFIQILMYLVHFSDFLIALGKEGPASWALDKEGPAG